MKPCHVPRLLVVVALLWACATPLGVHDGAHNNTEGGEQLPVKHLRIRDLRVDYLANALQCRARGFLLLSLLLVPLDSMRAVRPISAANPHRDGYGTLQLSLFPAPRLKPFLWLVPLLTYWVRQPLMCWRSRSPTSSWLPFLHI